MYQRKDYQTLRAVASVTSGFGWLIVGVWVLLGLVIGWQTNGFLVGLLLGVVLGIFGGIPFIVWGQLVSVFLDQKELLEEIAAQTKPR